MEWHSQLTLCIQNLSFGVHLKLKNQTIFDKYGTINDRREEFLQKTLADLIPHHGLRTAMDVGCGVGYFSNVLSRMALNVAAFDGRDENVTEARKRYPDIAFSRYDIEDARVLELEPRDFVLCFGLLYHLENPFRAIRIYFPLQTASYSLSLWSLHLSNLSPFLSMRVTRSISP